MSTPREWVFKIHDVLEINNPSDYLVIDRFSGDGSVLEVFKSLGYKVLGYTDMRDVDKDFLIYGDGFGVKLPHEKVINFVNPPFEYYIYVVRKDIEMFCEVNIYILDESIIKHPHMKIFFEHVELKKHKYIKMNETYKTLIVYG